MVLRQNYFPVAFFNEPHFLSALPIYPIFTNSYTIKLYLLIAIYCKVPTETDRILCREEFFQAANNTFFMTAFDTLFIVLVPVFYQLVIGPFVLHKASSTHTFILYGI